MYQEEMFANVFPGAEPLGSGCYGVVHAINEDWVVKRAACDGTLNYLEFCKAMQDSGMGMKGMPKIDLLLRLENDRYLVTMARYVDSQDDSVPDYYSDAGGSNAWGHDYIKAIETAYTAYMVALGAEPPSWGRTSYFTDKHDGNIMWDPRQGCWIATDPAGGTHEDFTGSEPEFPMYTGAQS